VNLRARLREVDEIVQARDAICPPGRGRPQARQGAAVLAGGTVLLSALFEGYVEDLFDATVDVLYSHFSTQERRDLKRNTSRKNHNASVYKVNNLFFYLGMPWVMKSPQLRWQKFSNASVRSRLDELAEARNKIAHGASYVVRKSSLTAWRGFVERLAEQLDALTADHVLDRTGHRPW
jgi:hypothetical protein